MNKIFMIQPWFTAKGHPAQSLLNTARALRASKDISYFISLESKKEQFVKMSQELLTLGDLNTFHVNSASLQEGTLKALVCLLKHRKDLHHTTVLFLDGHLIVFSFCWLFLRFWLNPERIGLLYLKGPERICGYWLTRRITAWLLSLKEFVFYLRTEELAQDWCNAFPYAKNIRTIPSLELSMHDVFQSEPKKVGTRQTCFGVIGQVRKGKGLEWLVPLFQTKAELGKLTVAGTFYDKEEEANLPQLQGFKGFRNEFLSELDMLACAREQDYLLMLYDHWDARMESAVLYLAARVRRPVIAYAQGWCGRKVSTFGCGVIISDHQQDWEAFFLSLPDPDSKEYAEFLVGIDSFVKCHSGDVARDSFLKALLE